MDRRTYKATPASRIEGELRVPGDKSISHRAVLLASVGEGPMEILGISPAQDVASSIACVAALGRPVRDSHPQVEPRSTGDRPLDSQVVVIGEGWDGLSSPSHPLDVGNSGTTIRLLLGLLAGDGVVATLDGDESIRRRPMLRVVDPLRRMGARIEGEGGGDRAPLRIEGAALEGMVHELSLPSAQVKSALLLAGLRASGETVVAEPAPTRDHTERILKYLKIPIISDMNRHSVKSISFSNASVTIPGDLSSAAFLLAAAAIREGSHIEVPGVGLNPTRTAFLDVLRRFGADVRVRSAGEENGEPRGTVAVRAGDRRPLEIAPEEVPALIDELPLVGVLGAFAPGETVVSGAAELRIKESDRIASLVEGLRSMGVEARSRPDGFTVRGGPAPRGGTVSSRGDHRIAMALAIAALGATGPTEIEGWDAVGVSYPGFERDLERVVVR